MKMDFTEVEMDLGIMNGQVVVPENGVFKTNVYVKDGKIHTISEQTIKAKKVIDATGKFVAPGIIDPHMHLGLYAPLIEELKSETKAAIVGGVTTVGDFFGGPQPHTESFLEIKKSIDAYAYTDVIPHLVIGTEVQKEQIGTCVKEFGVTSFKVYLNGVPGIVPWVGDEFILEVMEEMKKSGEPCILCAHCENPGIVAYATKKMKAEKAGKDMTLADWAETHPKVVEEEALQRLAALAKYQEVPVYIVHLFTEKGIEVLSAIKQNNQYLTVETTSPYLAINYHDPLGKKIKMEPPIQSPQDCDALWHGVAVGLIDTIGTDNVTMTSAQKGLASQDFWEVQPGYPAVQHHLPAMLHEGVTVRHLPIEKIIACMTMNPAKKFGIYPQKGSLNPGSDADIVVIDMDLEKKVVLEDCYSRSDFCIYEGRTFKGWPVATIKNGVIVAKDGKPTQEEPMGKCLHR